MWEKLWIKESVICNYVIKNNMILKYISNTRYTYINAASKMQDFVANLGKENILYY